MTNERIAEAKGICAECWEQIDQGSQIVRNAKGAWIHPKCCAHVWRVANEGTQRIWKCTNCAAYR